MSNASIRDVPDDHRDRPARVAPVCPSRRAAPSARVNEIARTRAEMADAGIAVTNLSDSNPTRHGLTDPRVLEAVRRHVAAAAVYDPDPRGLRTARQALASRFGGEAGDYWMTSSTSEAYSWLLTLFADPGEQVAIPAPGYPLVEPIARLAAVRTVDYRLHYVHSDGWILDEPTLVDAASNPSTRAVVVVNPGNPTGAYLGAARQAVVSACADNGAALIADEVFEPFALDATPETLAGETGCITVTLGGLSKLLCAPQLKLAWIRLSGPRGQLAATRDALDTVADTFLSVNAPVAAALPDLLDVADESVARTRERLRTNLKAARTIFSDGPYRVRRCEGGWTVVVDVPSYAASEDLALRLLRQAHLFAHPGWLYDLPGDGALAISLLPEPGRFADAIRRLRAAVDALA